MLLWMFLSFYQRAYREGASARRRAESRAREKKVAYIANRARRHGRVGVGASSYYLSASASSDSRRPLAAAWA